MGLLNRFAAQWFVALTTVAAGVPLPVFAQGQKAAEPVGHAIISRDGPDSKGLLRPILPIGDMWDWVSPADFPPAIFEPNISRSVRIRVTVDPSGAITGCAVIRSDLPEPFQQLACSLVRERGRFRHALASDGTPIAADIELTVVVWGAEGGPIPVPMAPSPAVPYEKPGYLAGWRLLRDPDWVRFAPAGNPDGEVRVWLSIYPPSDGQPERRYCNVGESSGNKALDVATCAAVKAASYAPIETPDRVSTSLEMLVHWRGGTASYQLPSQIRPTPVAIDSGLVIPQGLVRQRGEFRVTFSIDGEADCEIIESTGNDEADRMIFAYFRTLRFTPAIDIFGRKVASTRIFEFSPDGSQADRDPGIEYHH